MSELVLRDLEERLLDKLHQNAAKHGHSVEEEIKDILQSVIGNNTQLTVLERARAIRERNAHLQTSNTLDLLREDRESR